jgi:hypothetical protein
MDLAAMVNCYENLGSHGFLSAQIWYLADEHELQALNGLFSDIINVCLNKK